MPRRFLLFALFVLGCGTRNEIGVAALDGGTAEVANDSATNAKGTTRAFAVSFFRIGLTAPDGTPSTDAWRGYGFDLDGTCDGKGTCTAPTGAKKSSLTDGDGCIDNNFGSQLVPLVKSLAADAEQQIVAGIEKGGPTLVVRIDDLADSGEDADAPAAVFAAKSASGSAALDGNDTFDVDASSVDGDLSKPLAKMTGKVVMRDGVRVWSGTADRLALPAVFIAGATGAIPITGARIEIRLDQSRGAIGGYASVKDVQDVVSGLLAPKMICPGSPVYDQVQQTIAQAADMPATLPHDPAKTCEALSIGLGIEVVNAKIGKVVPTPTPKPPGC